MRGTGSRSLIELKSGSLINHQYHTLRTVFPNCEIILVCGSDWNKVREKCPQDIKIVINPLWETTNDVFSATLALVGVLNRKILIVYGDLLFDAEFVRNADLSKSSIYLHKDCQNDVGTIENNGKIENLGFGLPNKWAQTLYITGNELKLTCQILKSPNINKLLCHELINSVIDNGGIFNSIRNDGGKLLEIDNYKNLNLAKELVL